LPLTKAGKSYIDELDRPIHSTENIRRFIDEMGYLDVSDSQVSKIQLSSKRFMLDAILSVLGKPPSGMFRQVESEDVMRLNDSYSLVALPSM